ncbi:MAG: tyrosine-type recombinase/integrase [archaeon]
MVSKNNSFTGIDIHDHRKVLKTYLNRTEEDKLNKKSILDYYQFIVNDNLSISTQIKHLQVLLAISKQINKPFIEVKKDEMQKIVFKFRTNNSISPWTVHKYLVTLKKFYKWLYQTEDYPDLVKWIKSNVKNSQIKLPENLLSQEEVKKMINVCRNSRDKCILSMLNELGCRIGELLSIDINSMQDSDDYFRVTIQHSKTQPRKLKVIDSRHFIAQWLNEHSTKAEGNAPLFIGIGPENKNERLDYNACRALLRNIAKRAGIHKAVNPHHWRHSTATRYAKFMSYSQLCYWFGWAIGSKTASVYIHLSGQDLDSVVDEMRGKISIKKFEDTLAPKKCTYCHRENPGTNDLCEGCGASLTLNGVFKKEDRMNNFELEMKARQKVVEEYIKFQNEKLQRLEEIMENKN